MKNVLVAVDGSEPGWRAAEAALELARSGNGSLTVVNVVEPAFFAADIPWSVSGQVQETLERGAESVVAEAVKRLGPANVKVDGKVLHGDPGMAVCEEATKEGYDLVVVGSRGRSALQRVLLGSVAERVLHHCRLPVLVVR